MISRIHVNQHVIKANRKTGATDPVLTIKRSGKTIIANEVSIAGPSVLVYRPDKPLSCGAVVWVETTSTIDWR